MHNINKHTFESHISLYPNIEMHIEVTNFTPFVNQLCNHDPIKASKLASSITQILFCYAACSVFTVTLPMFIMILRHNCIDLSGITLIKNLFSSVFLLVGLAVWSFCYL